MHAEQSYLFRHALLRDAAYQLQLPSDRARLHLLAADIIESMLGGAPPARALNPVNTPPHPIDGVAREVCDHLRQAWLHARKKQTRFALELRLALYLSRAAMFAERQFDFVSAQALYLERADRFGILTKQRARDLLRASIMASFAYDLPLAKLHCSAALKVANAQQNRELEGAALSEIARLTLLSGQPTESLIQYEHALIALRQCNEPSRIGGALCNMAVAHQQLGRPEVAKTLLQEAVNVLEQANDPERESAALGNLAGLNVELGLNEEAEVQLQRALTIMRNSGILRGEGYVMYHLGNLYSQTARQTQADEAFRRSLEIHRQSGNREQEGWLAATLARRLQKQGRESESEQMFLKALAALDGTGKTSWIGSLWSNLAAFYFSTGRTQEAERAATESNLALREIEGTIAGPILEVIERARIAGAKVTSRT